MAELYDHYPELIRRLDLYMRANEVTEQDLRDLREAEEEILGHIARSDLKRQTFKAAVEVVGMPRDTPPGAGRERSAAHQKLVDLMYRTLSMDDSDLTELQRLLLRDKLYDNLFGLAVLTSATSGR